MLSPRVQVNLQNAKAYFREHLGAGEYYAQKPTVAGEWFGLGAERLELKGAVSERAFVALCEGLHPQTGEKLTARLNTVRQENGKTVANRRIFYDFTISPPKSVSVVGLYQDDRILEIHDRAVKTAMRELEKFALTQVRKGGGESRRVTGNLIGAAFRHETSRELDPHLHTHCVVLNGTFDPKENRWKALEASGLYRAQKLAENLYYHELCRGLRSLGYGIENHARGFEMKNVPVSLIQRFSKRHAQIDAQTQKRIEREGPPRNINIKDLRERVAHDGRRPKIKDATAHRLRPEWGAQMSREEQRALHALRPHHQEEAGKKEAGDVAALVAWADAHLFERRSVVNEHELMAAALARGRGLDFDLAALRQAIDQRGYLREAGTLTSREVLDCEWEIVRAARDGRNRHPSLSPDYQISPALSEEQRSAVRQILESRDWVTLFRGGAGTGKSFALQEVARGLVAAKQKLVVLAPQRQQVEDLQRDGLPAQTLAHFLVSNQLASRAVVIVDEAGQVGGREMRALIRLVQAKEGRLILSGDTRQHGAVAASDALLAIEEYGRLKPAEIQTIRRQNPELARSAEEKRLIGDYRSAVKAAADGRVDESFDRLDKMGAIWEIPEEQRRAALAAEYLAALARQERVLVVAPTHAEVRGVNEAVREELKKTGQLGAGETLTTYQAVDGTAAQRRDARFYYEAGQVAGFLQRYGRYAKGDFCEIVGANERGVVLVKDGRRSTVSYRYAERFIVAKATPLEIAPGDRLQLKFNGKSREGSAVTNGELVTVRALRRDGALVVEDERGDRKTLAATQRLFNRGYAVTSYAAQGKTVDTVLLADAANRAATNVKQWYVAISRGRKRVVVFTSDKAALREHVQQFGTRALALDLQAEAPRPSAELTRERLGENQPMWLQRAEAAIECVRSFSFVQSRREAVARVNPPAVRLPVSLSRSENQKIRIRL